MFRKNGAREPARTLVQNSLVTVGLEGSVHDLDHVIPLETRYALRDLFFVSIYLGRMHASLKDS